MALFLAFGTGEYVVDEDDALAPSPDPPEV